MTAPPWYFKVANSKTLAAKASFAKKLETSKKKEPLG